MKTEIEIKEDLVHGGRHYWHHVFETFASYTTDDITLVSFGRYNQTRGFAIVFYNDAGAELDHVGFDNKAELFGFVRGFNAAKAAELPWDRHAT